MNVTCPYTKNIDCLENKKKCENCGWNPDVSEKRIKLWKIRRRLEESNE